VNLCTDADGKLVVHTKTSFTWYWNIIPPTKPTRWCACLHQDFYLF